ncbi:hypothetical protein [Aquabacterium sp.]|uniref:hypothetical protein n=1 Tax=Aquabacterium sp. TaxID=1872578 RepID=UPI002CC952E9|nr:hypothetical protein [Aquabacterium sp.]HSW02990.1 hypothetical protein [Aquabacterium sp.]
MNKLIVLALAACAISPALAQPSVGISIGIHQPGVYGRINIGDLPAPALVLPQPVIIAQPQYRVERQPIYLYVPTPHQRDWRRYCGRYNACGQPVYFVRDQWVRERYQAEHPGRHHGHHRGWDKHDDRGHRGDHERGRGHDRGKGGEGRQADQPRHRHD